MSFTINDIRDIDADTLQMVGFSLGGKINGRIVSCAMSLANKELNVGGVDGYNDFLAELQAVEDSSEAISNMGFEPRMDKQKELACWVGARTLLIEAGQKPSPLSESFAFILNRTQNKELCKDDEAEKLAKLAGMSADDICKTFEARKERDVERTKDTIRKAMQIVADVIPDTTTNPPGLEELVLESIQSGRKSAIKMADNAEDALGSLMLLKIFEDTV